MEAGRTEHQEKYGEIEDDIIETRVEETVTEEVIEDVSQKSDKPETIQDTVKRAYEELKNNAKDNGQKDQVQEKKAESVVRDAKAKQERGVKKAKTEEISVVPPERLSLQEKEIFNKLPAEFKPAVARMFSEHQAHLTKATTELNRQISSNSGYIEAYKPFADYFAEQGLNGPQVFAGLLAAQRKLTNPQTIVPGYIQMIEESGKKEEILAALTGEAPAASQNFSNSREFTTLQSKINELESKLTQYEQADLNAQIEPLIQEGREVKNEIDSQGRYLWPELHDEDTVERRVKPLVSALMQTVPDLAYGDAIKRACLTLRGPNGALHQLNQTRLPQDNQTNNRAMTAAVSVRGKSSPSATGGFEIPENLPRDPKATVMMAYNQLKRSLRG